MKRNSVLYRIRTGIAAVMCLFVMMTVFPAVGTAADPDAEKNTDTSKTVRVGWYDSTYNQVDEAGRKMGYTYEYQRKIAAYTGWNYEYVEASWPDLFEMLKKGEIDLMSDVTYTKERSKQMLFPDYAMGSEEYYLYISVDNVDKFQDDYSYFNGKKIGVNKGSVQVGYFREWEKKQNFKAELVELTSTEDESVEMLKRGEIDAYISLDNNADVNSMIPVAKIGYSEIYFVVNNNRHDLLEELNTALRNIQNEDRFYNDDLYAKYVQSKGTHLFVDKKEKKWLEDHGSIRIGYLDNYLAFCAEDEKTGKLTGALKDYLDEASHCLANVSVDFEPVAFRNMSKALEALKKGEIDCIFPANFSVYEGEQRGIFLTLSIADSSLYTLVRSEDKKSFTSADNITTAVEKDNLNYDSILLDYYPKWKKLECDSVQDCLKSVADGKADCFIISSYCYNNLSTLCDQYNLTALDTGNSISFSIAVNNTQLYSILDKIVSIMPDTTINMALTQYFSDEQKENITLLEFLKKYLFFVIAVVVLIIAMLMLIIIQRRLLVAEKNARKQRQIADDLSRRVFVDALTSVRNKGGYSEYIQMLQERLKRSEVKEYAVCMFDCDDLKYINDKYGHDKGDVYLKTAVRLICRTFQHSPVFRIGGDEFCAVLQGDDYERTEELTAQFESESSKINRIAENEWEKVNISMGIAKYQSDIDSTVEDTVSRADQIMYENKRERKAGRGVR